MGTAPFGPGASIEDGVADEDLLETLHALAADGTAAIVGAEDLEGPPSVASTTTKMAAPADLPGLQLSEHYLARAREVREAFSASQIDTSPSERLLEELVAGEVAIATGLMDAEGALLSLLQRTITDPARAIEVARVFKETTALSSAVRRRIETTLSTVADLRAQRQFVQAERRHRGV